MMVRMLINGNAFKLPFASSTFHAVITSPPYWNLRYYDGEQGARPLGNEETPGEHIDRLVVIFKEVRRVLRDDGIFWLNYDDKRVTDAADVKSGSLLFLPHRLALAMQDDGWLMRDEVIWHKRGGMPESVTGVRYEREKKGEIERTQNGAKQLSHRASKDDKSTIQGGRDKVIWEYGDSYKLRRGSWRHTREHEYIFQAVKASRYWADQEIAREPLQDDTPQRMQRAVGNNHNNTNGAPGQKAHSILQERTQGAGYNHPKGKNPRGVLDIPSKGYRGGHYATFPPELVRRLMLPSVPRWVCPVCQTGWAPVVEPNNSVSGYRPLCKHPHTIQDTLPGIVLDPFVGSGTVPMVARWLGLRWVGVDISWDYLDQDARVRARYGQQKAKIEGLPLFHDSAQI